MAKEQLAVAEMITNLILGKTSGKSRVDFSPQKKVFPSSLPCEQPFERATPESQGISSDYLASMIREMHESKYTEMHHLMVLRHGKVICECNFAPYRKGIWHITHSMCKSITGMAIGMLIHEGLLSLDENIYKIFESRLNPLVKIFRPVITVENLLTMTSGVTFHETGIISGNDWLGSFLNAPVAGKPGSEFLYNSMNSYVLSAIVTERTGLTLAEYLRPRLFEPLGITKYFWETCPKGITKGGWGLFLCAEDMAKLGQLYLQKGKWKDVQLVPEDWVEVSTQKHVETGENTFGYGYQLWMEHRPGSFEFNGMLGQNVIVYPDIDMVIVTNAGNNELFQDCIMLNIIRKYFHPEFFPAETLPENPGAWSLLLRLTSQMENGGVNPSLLRRGGWKKNSHRVRKNSWNLLKDIPLPDIHQCMKQLDKKEYSLYPQNAGLFPLFIQVFHNNMTEGVRTLGFSYEKGAFFVNIEEGSQWLKIKVGFGKGEEAWLTLHEESYLVSTHGEFTTDENGTLVLKLEMTFLEECVKRKIYIFFHDDKIETRWFETPGKDMIIAGLESVTEELAANFLYSAFKDKGGLDVLHRLMGLTIEPVIMGCPKNENTSQDTP